MLKTKKNTKKNKSTNKKNTNNEINKKENNNEIETIPIDNINKKEETNENIIINKITKLSKNIVDENISDKKENSKEEKENGTNDVIDESETNEKECIDKKDNINRQNTNISTKLVKQRQIRQDYNNKLAYDSIKINLKEPCVDNINKNALDRLLAYTNYNDLEDMIKDKNNHEEIITKITSLYIAKNSSRQGMQDEEIQLNIINTLQAYDITIERDGKQKPIKGGGISISKKKQVNELKSIDFIIKYNHQEIGYIMAKVTSGEGGHQDNVLEEITQFCEWSLIQQAQHIENKVYIVLYDNLDTSHLFEDIKEKYKNRNLILTNTDQFKDMFLSWFTENYK